jgi:cytochrome P450
MNPEDYNSLPDRGFIRTPPRPQGWPVIGVLPGVWRDPLQFLLEMSQQYGDVVQIDLSTSRFYLASHPEQVKYVLQDNTRNFTKAFERAKPLFGKGLYLAEGESWRAQRGLVQPLLQPGRMKVLLPVVTSAVQEMQARWEQHGPGRSLDLAAEMANFTQTILIRLMFGEDARGVEGRIFRALRTALDYLSTAFLAPTSVMASQPSAENRRFRQAMAEWTGFIDRTITARRRARQKPDDLLSLLIEARAPGGEGLSDEEVRDEVLSIFLAGYEPVSALLAWTMFLLPRHGLVEETVRAELERVLNGRVPAMEDLPRLVYTRQVIDEVLRLYPPVWFVIRRAVMDDELGGFHLPAGSLVMLSPYVTHHLPAFWENPEKFDPARFAAGKVSGRPRFSYFPFGGGPRMCVGSSLAITVALAALSTLLPNFQISVDASKPVHLEPAAVLRPREGVPARVERIGG